MKYRLLLLTSLMMLTVSFTGRAQKNKNILQIRESVIDNHIVYPHSFETDTREMMENWYIKNYAIVDEQSPATKNTGAVSDKEYKRRLSEMKVVIEMPFNQVVKSYIERYVVKSRTLVAQMLALGAYYNPIFEDALERHGLPLELKYIPVIESALNPNAVSPAGAGGLWQFMVATAKGNGIEVNSVIDERRDPYKSSEAAAIFFKKLYETYGDWSLAIAAYNCGPGNVNKAIRRTGNEHADFWEIYNYLPKETRGYVPAFIAANYAMTYYREHGINPSLTKKPLITDTVMINKRVNFSQISQVLNISMDELRILNPQYRADYIPGTAKNPCSLTLPSQQIYAYINNEPRVVSHQKEQFTPREEVQPGDVKSVVGDETDLNNTTNGIEYHEVVEGEDFADIAARYEMNQDDLMELNNLKSTQVRPGQVLTVMRKGSRYNRQTVMNGNNNRNNSYNNSYNNNSYNNYNSQQGSQRNYNNQYSQNDGRPYDADHRQVPARRQQASTPPAQQQNVPQRQNYAQPTNKPAQNNNNVRNQQDDEAKKKREQEYAAKKKKEKEEAVAKKKKEEEAKKKREQEYAAKKKKEQEEAAAKKKKEEEERKRREEAAKPIQHQVKEGQSLEKLARQYGVTVADIRAANPNLKGDVIQPNQKLNIPKKGSGKQQQQAAAQQKKDDKKQQPAAKQQQTPARPSTHTVQEGDNLTKLANKYGVSVSDLRKANPNVKGDNIQKGTKINIPKK